jgi:magnesium chelatase family protein
MATKVLSASLLGVEAVPIEVEVDLLARLPAVVIVGLPTSAVRESAERVRSAMEAAGEEFPRKRVVINLAPADLRKDGTALDLPMALGILTAAERIPERAAASVLAAGELALDGRLRPIRGALSLAVTARDHDRVLVVPRANAAQAAMVPGVTVWPADDLQQVVRWLCAEEEPEVAHPAPARPPPAAPDLRDVRGQHRARRALEVAAAGGHHVLLMGPPGCGKSMLAQRLPSILPPLTFEDALATSRVHSAAGLLTDGGVVEQRPFRAPHHTVTVAGLVGDRRLRPGEIALAHQGVLFLDEASEFRRTALEVLRQPLEDGALQITRAAGTIVFPAAITLVLASNPCPCGHLGSPKPCVCSETAVAAYRRRLSGPILDRIDLHVELTPVSPEELLHGVPGEPSDGVRERVVAARQRQHARGQEVANARLDPDGLQRHAPLDDRARALLLKASEVHGLSARSTRRLHKVARTLADLAGRAAIEANDVAAAVAFRAR